MTDKSMDSKAEIDAEIKYFFNKMQEYMNISSYRLYILILVFYKYLSLRIVKCYEQNRLLFDNLPYKEAYSNEIYAKDIELFIQMELGYFIEPNNLFSAIVIEIERNQIYINGIVSKIYELMIRSSEKYRSIFSHIFNLFEREHRKLCEEHRADSHVVENLFCRMDTMNCFSKITEDEIFSRSFEVLIRQFNIFGGVSKFGFIDTPSQLSKLISKLITYDKKEIKKLYDPACRSSSLLIRFIKEVKVNAIYGQEINFEMYLISNINFIIHGLDINNLDIKNDDTLKKPMHLDLKFDAIISRPPFNLKWNTYGELDYDPRFNKLGIAPKRSADLAFVQHMIYQLSENGTMAVILPHGVLFRGNAEKYIRKSIINQNLIDAVIGLPKNIFYGANLETFILIIKKNRKNEDVLFIDASREYENNKMINIISDENINKIVDTYVNRREIYEYSSVVKKEQIVENDFNLSIAYYIDIYHTEELLKNYKYIRYELKDIVSTNDSEEYDTQEFWVNRRFPLIITDNELFKRKKSDSKKFYVKSDIILVEYLEYFLNSEIGKNMIAKFQVGYTNSISINDLLKVKIPIPEIEMQKNLLQNHKLICESIEGLNKHKDSILINPDSIKDVSYAVESVIESINVSDSKERHKLIIKNGETLQIEFKRDFKSCSEKIIKEICAFMNTMGGTLYVGVEDNGDINGIDDYKSTDELMCAFNNAFKDRIPQYRTYVLATPMTIDEKTIIIVKCLKSREPIFYERNDKKNNTVKKYFYVKNDKSSEAISDNEEIVNYILSNIYKIKNKFEE